MVPSLPFMARREPYTEEFAPSNGSSHKIENCLKNGNLTTESPAL